MILLKVLIGVIVWIKLLKFSVIVTPEFIRRRIKKMKAVEVELDREASLLSILLAIPVFFLAKKVGAPHPVLIAIGAMFTIGIYFREIRETEEDKLAEAQFRAQFKQLVKQGKIKEALKLFGKHITTCRAWE